MIMFLPAWFNQLFVAALLVAIAATLLDIARGSSLYHSGRWNEYLSKPSGLHKLMAGAWSLIILMVLYMEFPLWWPWLLSHLAR